eukprot:TRINITY_DN1966_c0_g2_i4.p1 TRINITY_DN1966_c0_g2~~TRINITY_DN1966_c0_g2_i4.p1  ORF type:complete len:166 (-),score=36.85 TRINITY_DN1966_c0_g2_i4:244-741(-)
MEAVVSTQSTGTKDWQSAIREYHFGIQQLRAIPPLAGGKYGAISSMQPGLPSQVPAEDLQRGKELLLILNLNLSQSLLNMEKYERVLEILTEVIKDHPNQLKAHFRRGQAHFALKNFQKALEDFLKVLEIDPEHKLTKPYLAKLESWNKKQEENARQIFVKMFTS